MFLSEPLAPVPLEGPEPCVAPLERLAGELVATLAAGLAVLHQVGAAQHPKCSDTADRLNRNSRARSPGDRGPWIRSSRSLRLTGFAKAKKVRFPITRR